MEKGSFGRGPKGRKPDFEGRGRIRGQGKRGHLFPPEYYTIVTTRVSAKYSRGTK